MKIIHCADLHLDSKMESNLDREAAGMRRDELLDTFDNIVWDAINALTFVDELYRKEK